MTTVKLFKQGHSIVAAIPRYFRSRLKLNSGDILVVESSGDALILRKLSHHPLPSSGAAVATAGGGDTESPVRP